MNLLLILLSFSAFNLKGYLAVGIPTGESRTLIKSGGTVGVESSLLEWRLVSAGASFEASSFLLLGSGNSEIKLMSIAPAIFVTPPLPGDALHLKGKINLTHFQIHNPAYTKTIYTTGLSLGSDIKITDKPLKIYLTVQYSNYQGTKKNFAFYNLGFGLRL